MPITNRRSATNWDRAQHAYNHYQRFIHSKPDRYALSFADLVFVKNFKGGSALIAEPVQTLTEKLGFYERALRECAADEAFSKLFPTMSEQEYLRFCNRTIAFATLPEQSESDISGFGCSFASALLHFYFPGIVPILDKRALNGSGIQGLEVDRGNNVTNLLGLYPALINAFRERLIAQPSLTLRDVDRQFFIQRLLKPPFRNRA